MITIIVSRLITKLLLANRRNEIAQIGRATVEYETYYQSDWVDFDGQASDTYPLDVLVNDRTE